MRFELTEACASTVFKTATFDRSVNPPKGYAIIAINSPVPRGNFTKREVFVLNKDELVKVALCGGGKVVVLGASDKAHRPVSDVMAYLKAAGVVLFPINPRVEGKELLGLPCLGSLAQIEEAVDIVSIFLSSSMQDGLADQIKAMPGKPAVWFQPGAENPDLQTQLTEMGHLVVVGDCMKVAHRRNCTVAHDKTK